MAGNANSGGRNRKSQAEHALTGTGRKDRGTKAMSTSGGEPPAALPEPPKGRPRTPSWLTGFALVEWDRMVVRLEAAKTLSTVDDAALYQYCCLFAETEAIVVAQRGTAALLTSLLAAIEKWARLVDLIEAAAAKSNANPIAAALKTQEYSAKIVDATAQIVQLKKLEAKYPTQLRQGHMALRQMLVEFGMTPAARNRVSPAPGADPPPSSTDRFTKPRG